MNQGKEIIPAFYAELLACESVCDREEFTQILERAVDIHNTRMLDLSVYAGLMSIGCLLALLKGSFPVDDRGFLRLIEAVYPVCLEIVEMNCVCLLYTSPSPRDRTRSRMPSSA